MESYPHISSTPQSEAEWFAALTALARFLRSPAGCPWDRKQTSRNFAEYSREEAGELASSCASGTNEDMEEEWGDTLFTLLACMAAAEEEGRFSLGAALEKAHAKMIRRHGHIFGGHAAETPEDVARMWQKIKMQEQASKNDMNRERS